MEIIQVVGLGLVATILVLIVKEQKPLFAFLLSAFTGITIFMFLVSKLGEVVHVIENLATVSNVNSVFFKTVLKMIGIAYIAEFGAQIIRDSGQEAIASKVELAGKVLILYMSIPIITVIIETVMKLLPT